MYRIFFYVFMFNNVIAKYEESNEKYIDLLPEEEKQEFLNRIARRILEGIKSNDTPNESHAEITDDQLETQDAFVKQIFKEESKNLKYKRRQSDGENDKIEINNVNKNENNDSEVESNTGDKEEHIDLTLRQGKRQKRKNGESDLKYKSITEMSYDVIPVKTVYDQFENNDVIVNTEAKTTDLKDDGTVKVMEEVNTLKKNDKNLTSLESGQDSVTVINDLGSTTNLLVQANNELISDSLNESDRNVENLRKSFDNKFKFEPTKMLDFDPNSNEHSLMAEVTDTTTRDENIWVSTQKIYDGSEEKEEETTTAYYTTSDHTMETVKETITTSPADVIKISKDEGLIIENINVTTSNLDESKSELLRSDKQLKPENHINENVKSTPESSIETTSKSILLSSSDNTLPSIPVTEVTTDIQHEARNLKKIGTTESVSDINKHIMVFKNSEVATDIKKDDTGLSVTESVHVAISDGNKHIEHNTEIASEQEKNDNNKTVLRERLDSLDMSQINEYESVKHFDEDSMKLKVYEVFEVDPNKPHFVTSGKTQQNEHPLYVPVYNYAPENAYFKPYNKFGPNIEDFYNKDTPETNVKQLYINTARNRFSGYSNNKKGKRYTKKGISTKQPYKKQTNKKPREYDFMKLTKKKHNQEIKYNPNDYADLDYYVGRILRRRKKTKGDKVNTNKIKRIFPDSNDDTHPINVIHKSDTIKDHVRAIRNLFYLKKLFGYVPKVRDRGYRKTDQYLRKSKQPEGNIITMDSYFDRTNPVKEKENELLRLNTHNSNLNIQTLTPKPPNFKSESETIQEKLDLDINKYSESIKHEMSNVPFKKLFESMVVVLKDSIKVNNEKLAKYDWLKTTVNIQAALGKLFDLIEQLKYGRHVNPKDIELLKYIVYIFKSSKTTLEAKSMNENVRLKDIEDLYATRRSNVIKFPKPKTKQRNREAIKLWMKFITSLRSDENNTEGQDNTLLSDFEDLLRSLLFNLKDLHNAIKHISIITEYKNQNWLEDLNNLYLRKDNNKGLGKVILHLGLSRLLDSIEDSSLNGVEEGFRQFLEKNRDIVNRSFRESLFVLNVLEEIKSSESASNI